jgi:exosortase/archaeosortase family protein
MGYTMRNKVYSITVVAAVLIYAIFSFPGFYPFPQITAFFASKILALFGYTVVNVGNLLVLEGFNPVRVSGECSGIMLLLAFIITIHLLPVLKTRHKVGSLILIPVILFGNFLRIVMSMLAGVWWSPDAMIFFHNSFSQVFIFVWSIAAYLIWLHAIKLFPLDKFNEKLFDMME